MEETTIKAKQVVALLTCVSVACAMPTNESLISASYDQCEYIITEYDDLNNPNTLDIESYLEKTKTEVKEQKEKLELEGERASCCDRFSMKVYRVASVPDNNSNKTYMDAKFITNQSSPQYKLKSSYVLSNEGVWTVDGRYCVAVGSYYTTTIGTYIDVLLDNGTVIPCIVADCKADIHTDSTNRQNPNGSVIEFIVHTSSLSNEVCTRGNVSYARSDWEGEISYLRVYTDEGHFINE